MEEAPENGKESSHSAHANGMNELKNSVSFLHMMVELQHFNLRNEHTYPVLCVDLHTLVEHTELPLCTYSTHRPLEHDIKSDVRKFASIKPRPPQKSQNGFSTTSGTSREDRSQEQLRCTNY